jgi:hypothetical protein
VGSVSLYLVEILLLSSLSLGPLHVNGSADMDKGFLRYPHLLLPHGEGFLAPCKLPLSCKELLNRCSRRRQHDRARRQRRRK